MRFTNAGTERWLESGRASIDMFHVARSPMQKYELRGDPLPRQVHYYRYEGLQHAYFVSGAVKSSMDLQQCWRSPSCPC